VLPKPKLRIADVTLFYGERSGGIRTYLDAKASWNREVEAFEHHVITPGRRERHENGRHELPSLRVTPANGYRVPFGGWALQRTLRAIQPDVVCLHDPFWAPLGATAAAHGIGARVVVVHHGSSEMDARAIPGPSPLYVPLLRAWMRTAYGPADEVMSAVDPTGDCGRPATLPLRLGVDPAFRPQPDVRRRDHTLYVGRLAREKGVFALVEAAARATEPWPLRLVGSGPAEDAVLSRAERLGTGGRVSIQPFVTDRERLARLYAGARCVVLPGEHETFGLAALEAAACGARVVCCTTAPSRRALGGLAHPFRPGDIAGLAQAISSARAAPRDPAAAAAVARRHAWPALFEAEVATLRRLVS
jgi:alpha-1,6-mannosyltransferase